MATGFDRQSSWDEGIEPFRFDLPSEAWDGPVVVHTVFDRSLFRAGETVHMKHLLRQESLAGFAFEPGADVAIRLPRGDGGADDTSRTTFLRGAAYINSPSQPLKVLAVVSRLRKPALLMYSRALQSTTKRLAPVAM